MAHRIERVNNLIRRELSELLQRQVKDPRLGSFVTVTQVSASSDLRYAKVFVSSIHGVEDRQEMLSALSAASGFLRNELSRGLRLRRIPTLSFYWDDSIERGVRIIELIDQVSIDSTPQPHRD